MRDICKHEELDVVVFELINYIGVRLVSLLQEPFRFHVNKKKELALNDPISDPWDTRFLPVKT